ncbi:hypothetical protein G7B40_039355 [Aetokthonos hydrillicola Thurmond2011]|jgi:hypothetical protein|uniref:Channel forming colicins domain-containing protein n=1 Tax=Aetokthonos hydrillicola Thurmond2011 TaxID=2712845 RepID=A0AAP5IFA8_9CYAN|nr:hypothetical protein [Aetokthonos hydrillicola]MBO3463973.1 hypothetical protein [Aetokthonos hydrillicola CCALA 1050]MBW4591153.1 hypothetical protein [Aetokthonos hydrillicola CCALA 1050]MDR9900550.1 hypothetical protein [Aetokthonos hydrillicola Thurmond2011]
MSEVFSAICYYYNGQLLTNSIAQTITNKESSIKQLSEGYITALNVLERKLGVEHVRIFRTPYKANTFKHITRTAQWEPYFLSIESQINDLGLTDIFIVECIKDNPVSEDKLIIDEYRDEYYVGFLMLPGNYESLEELINFYRGLGYKTKEITDTIERFLTHVSPMSSEDAYHFDKLKRLAANDNFNAA